MWRMCLWKWNILQFQCHKFRPVKVEGHHRSKPQPILNRYWAFDKWDLLCAFTWDCSCQFLFLLAPCCCLARSSWVVGVNRGSRLWHGYFFTCLKRRGEADLQRFQICLLISALRMPVPKVRGTNICWIVSYISELRTYLTFFVGSNRTIVFSADLDCSISQGYRRFLWFTLSLTDRDKVLTVVGYTPKWSEDFTTSWFVRPVSWQLLNSHKCLICLSPFVFAYHRHSAVVLIYACYSGVLEEMTNVT